MDSSGPALAAPSPPGADAGRPPAGPRHPLALRLAAVLVLALWLTVVTGAVLGGSRVATWDDLQADLRAGSVAEVTVVGGLPAGARGSSEVELVWQVGPVLRRAQVLQVSGPGAGMRAVGRSDVSELVRRPLPAELRDLDPGVRVVTAARRDTGPEMMGWRAPGWLSVPVVVGFVSTLALVPLVLRPRVATSWGWGWLVLMTVPLGPVAFLVGSGVLRAHGGVATRPDRRLSGGWAFLLALVLGSVLTSGG